MTKLMRFGLIVMLALPTICEAANVAITGCSYPIIEIAPEASTGLNNIFVAYNTAGCKINFQVSNGYNARLYRYSNLGGGYAEEITAIERTLTSIEAELSDSDMGYIVEDGGMSYYCWVVNYNNHKMILQSVGAAENQDCNYSILLVTGDAGAITYYTISGQPRILSREIYVDYTSQEFDETLPGYRNSEIRKVYDSIGTTLSITPPAYSSTYFTLSGDRFLREWGMEVTAGTNLVQPIAVECATDAFQEGNDSEEGSNIMHGEDSGLGGSAPADISFFAYATEGVIHYEWQMSRNPDFETPDYRFYQKDLDYTFTEEGTFYLRFIGSNSDGTCEAFGDTYTVSIGSSALECPNAFSPNDDGVNDIWKVSYRSLIDFHCEIFNRNGQRIYGFDDPSDGWDGTWNGKKVKSGVYYYVISAKGADGKNYKKSGDINIINSVIFDNGSSYPEGDY